jgi:hypothetical protein
MNLRSTMSIAIFFLILPALCSAGDTKLTKKTIKAADTVNIVCEVRGQGDTALMRSSKKTGDPTYTRIIDILPRSSTERTGIK